MTLTIGVDVGGTKVAAGVVDAEGRILAKVLRPTPGSTPPAVADAIAGAIAELRAGHRVEAVGIGAAGYVNRERSRVLFAPNLAWRDEPLRDEVANRTGLRVVVENDANATAWGEYRYGAGRGHEDLVCVTVGTGIGGGIVIGGRLFRGTFGIGGEVGHMQLVPDGRRCGCGNQGCWEQYCSGRALVREARSIAAASPALARGLIELAGSAQAIDGPHVTQAAANDDPAARECFDTIGRWLGRGLANVAAILDPGRFVIGGGVSEAGDLLLEPARQVFHATLTGRGFRPEAEIVPAEAGPSAGLIGAADLARRLTSDS